MTVDELDACGDDAVGNGDGLLRIARIVKENDLDGFAIHTAVLVDGLRGQFRAVLDLPPMEATALVMGPATAMVTS